MITRRAIIASGLAAGGVTACGQNGGSPGAGPSGPIRFSILSTEAAQSMEQYWTPILADMQSATGMTVKPFFSSNYTLLIEAMQAKKTDLGWFSNRSGLEAVRRAGGEVFARTFDPSGVDGYTSVLIVNARSKLTLPDVLRCDKTLTLGMGDVLSTSGTLAPMTYLFAPRDIRPAACFKKLRSGASHQTNLYAVAAGQLDVATNNSASLLLNRQRGRHEADEVRVIWRSPILPEDPIIWRKDLDPAIKEKLRQFLLTYGQGSSARAERQRGYMARLNIGGFRPADDSFLLPVREMEATELWLAAKQTGDKRQIADARQSLDAITAQRVALEARTRAPAADQ
ncbi:MAG TPA: phosphate/phosphite/phosphonate ABC transporter substrate-binding protein [Caulobacteraceae bacterium]